MLSPYQYFHIEGSHKKRIPTILLLIGLLVIKRGPVPTGGLMAQNLQREAKPCVYFVRDWTYAEMVLSVA